MCEKSGFYFRQTGIIPSRDQLIDVNHNVYGIIEIVWDWAKFNDMESIAVEYVHQDHNEKVHFA